MAGIEKICEYSGEYPGGVMYGYKRNLIQVMPQYRKLFRGQEHELIIKTPVLYWDLGGCVTKYYEDSDIDLWYPKARLVEQYEYCLKVPSVPGNVEGEYWNHTYHLPTALRKLKRMLRCRKLNIVWSEI